jgi:hypothetical protein
MDLKTAKHVIPGRRAAPNPEPMLPIAITDYRLSLR